MNLRPFFSFSPASAEADRAARADLIRLCVGDDPAHCDLCGEPVTPDNLAGADEDGRLYCTRNGLPLAQPERAGF